MSRIGKKPIFLPSGVTATHVAGAVQVQGPKGALQISVHPNVSVTVDSDATRLTVSVKDANNPKQRALWGLSRQLLSNAVQGVQKPFEKSLELVGVGFKVSSVGVNMLKFDVGFSHPVQFEIPAGIEVAVDKQVVTLKGIEKQLVGETAARIRRIRPPEPYKGKGIKYTAEVIRRKAGKTAVKGA